MTVIECWLIGAGMRMSVGKRSYTLPSTPLFPHNFVQLVRFDVMRFSLQIDSAGYSSFPSTDGGVMFTFDTLGK